MTLLSRRRFLAISAACAAVPTITSAAPVARWRGTALGAKASLQLVGLDDAQAAPFFSSIEAELSRLENIFSLYRPQSQLSRLNRDGTLPAPAPELLNVLSLCSALHAASDGAFDPTIQPVWQALALQAKTSELAAVRKTVGWQRVRFDARDVRLPVPGISALTLNGIAQGVITDRVAALLRSLGLRDVMVDMGEIVAMGSRKDGRPWQVGLSDTDGAVIKEIALRDRAVATSSATGTVFADGKGHILNPNGQPVTQTTVSVSAPEAALADGLSTALCAAPAARAQTILKSFPMAKLEMRSR